MISAISTKRHFKTLQSLLDEQKRLFKQYASKITEALEVNKEIIAYVREKCEGKYEQMLSEMERDNKIFTSRLKHLKTKLDVCVAYFSDTERYYEQITKGNQRAAMHESCLVNFLKFYDEKADIHNQLKQAQRRWLKIQDYILAKID
jgi:hypothetical protein